MSSLKPKLMPSLVNRRPTMGSNQPEPDECGQTWPDVVVTVGLWSGIVFFVLELGVSALRWHGIL